MLFICFNTPNIVFGQYHVVSPSYNESTFVPSTATGNVTWLNNASFYNQSIPFSIKAVVWDDGSDSWFKISDGTYSYSSKVAMSGSSTPDVIVGGDANDNAYLGVVYNNSGNIYLDVYTITNIGNVSFGVSTCGTYTYPITVTQTARVPHIDALNAPCIGFTKTLSDGFVIAWEDNACSVNGYYGARACVGSIVNSATNCVAGISYLPGCVNRTSGPPQFITDAENIDAAMYMDASIGLMVKFTYVDPYNSYNLYYSTWHTTWSSPSAAVNIDNNTNGIKYPRIDVFDAVTNVPSTSMDIVYDKYGGTNTTWEVYTWNPSSGQDASADYDDGSSTGTGRSDNSSPAVTLASNGLISFTYSNAVMDSVYEQNIDCSSGNITTTSGDKDYYSVNTSSNATGPVAITTDWAYDVSSSDVVPNDLFICWYNPGLDEIDYKVTSNPTSYKTTGIQAGAVEHVNSILISNPANDYTIIRCPNGGRNYKVADLYGKTVKEGCINNIDTKVSLNTLPAGTYILYVNCTDGITDVHKLIKY